MLNIYLLLMSLILILSTLLVVNTTKIKIDSDLKLCQNVTAINCCAEPGKLICNKCDLYCPCKCNSKRLIAETTIPPTSLQSQLTQPVTSSDVSFSAYTLILSIGLPSVSIILIICTLLSITYCCKPRPLRNADNSTVNNGSPVSVSNLSLVYINLDENNNNVNKIVKEPPPKYSDYIKSSFVDKLPSYKSFRGIKTNTSEETNNIK